MDATDATSSSLIGFIQTYMFEQVRYLIVDARQRCSELKPSRRQGERGSWMLSNGKHHESALKEEEAVQLAFLEVNCERCMFLNCMYSATY